MKKAVAVKLVSLGLTFFGKSIAKSMIDVQTAVIKVSW